jgi:hypothetical protein
MNIDIFSKELDRSIGALHMAFADGVNEDGEPIIKDSDTLDDLIEIIDIISRVQSRKIRALKREHESIL